MQMTAADRKLIELAATKIASELMIGLNSTGFISARYSAGADEKITRAIAALLTSIADLIMQGKTPTRKAILVLAQLIFSQFGLTDNALITCGAAIAQLALTGIQGTLEATAAAPETGCASYVVAAVFVLYDGLGAYETCAPLLTSESVPKRAWPKSKAVHVVHLMRASAVASSAAAN
jgi:hypothetical protein